MKILHQKDVKSSDYRTLCGLDLTEDIRRRDDMLLATLDLEEEDITNNFGEDAKVCIFCKISAIDEEEYVIDLESSYPTDYGAEVIPIDPYS